MRGTVLFLFFWLLLLFAGRSKFFHDPGTFWHTVVGEKILTQGFFDRDPFTYSHAGNHWVPHQWLGEVTMALVHRVAGLDGELVVATAVIAGLFAYLTARLLRTGLHPILIFAVVGLALAASTSHFHIRPHLGTIVGTAMVSLLLTSIDGGTLSPRAKWLLPPLFLIWSNLHGGALGGLMMFVMMGTLWSLLRLFGGLAPIANFNDWLGWLLAGLASFLVPLATPYGSGVVLAWRDILAMKRLPEFIKEHAQADLADPATWPVLLLGVATLFVMAGLPRKALRASLILPLFWLAQSYFRVRHAPLFAVSALVMIAEFWPKTIWCEKLSRSRPDLQRLATFPWEWSATLLPVGLVVLVLSLQSQGIARGIARLDPEYWPVDSIDAVQKIPDGHHVFSDYIDGGFLIYHAPQARVFVDDRCELFGEEWLADFVKASYDSTKTDSAMIQWTLQHGPPDEALVRSGSPFDEWFAARPQQWEMVQKSAISTLYRRK